MNERGQQEDRRNGERDRGLIDETDLERKIADLKTDETQSVGTANPKVPPHD